MLEKSPRLYEKIVLETSEYKRLNEKTFKTKEVEERIFELKNEIANSKNELNMFIRKYYGDYYKNNDVYKPISSRVDGKFVYALGYQNLNNFVEYGIWPTKEDIENIKFTRTLNKKTADDAIIKIELAKVKYANLYNEAVINKNARLAFIEDKMTKLVGNWKNPMILNLIDDHFSTKMMDEELLATFTGVKEADSIINNIRK